MDFISHTLTAIGLAISGFFAVPTEPVMLGAQTAFTAFQGGTGTSSPSGILYGDETIRLKTARIGTGISFAGGTLSAVCLQITGSAALCDGDDASAAGAGAYPFTPGTFGSTNVSATTTAIQDNAGFISTGSSTLQRLVSEVSTSTSATTTNLYSSGYTRLGSLSGVLIGASGVVSTGVDGTDFSLINANTCSANQAFTSVTAAGVFGCGGLASTTLLADLNTFTNLQRFNNGITAYASSTIGSGAAALGLTISGNATSTGLFTGANGAETGPTYTFNTDGNTGMFLVSSGILGFTIDGVGHAALNSTNFYPYTNDATALGIASNGWSDLFLATGAVIGFGNGNASITHSAGALTVSAGTLFDLGGSILEVPNGANPTADDPGEVAHDTTDNMWIGDDFVIGRATERIWAVTVASTSPAFVSGGLLPIPNNLDGYTVTRYQCHVTDGTSKIIAVEDASANSSEDITCATTNTTDDGSITNGTFTASELGFIDFGATSGSVNYVTIEAFGQWTRE